MGKRSVREEKAIGLVKRMVHGFYEKTIHPRDLLPYLSETCFVWIGAAEGEVYTSVQDAITAYAHQRDGKEIPLIRVGPERYRAFTLTPTVILVVSETVLSLDTADRAVLSEKQRGTYVFHVERGALKFAHIHVSNPWSLMSKEKRFPLTAGRASYEYMQQLIADKESQNLPDLTARQKLVLELLSQGKTYKEIGKVMEISPNTVRYHVGELTRKFRVSSRSELIAAANRMKRDS